jgi:hypothetical protein
MPTHMRKRTAANAQRGSNRSVAPAEEAAQGPARIPGVHIGHIGGRIGAVAGIQAYWLARGAVFLHHSLEPGQHLSRLEEILERSHVVFHVRVGTGCEFARSLERYCERRDKPLILLDANNVAALAEALATSLPLT